MSNATGKPFEAEVERVLGHYRSRGVMRVCKIDPPTVIRGKLVIQKENPFLDYVGVWTACGNRSLMIEAKSTKEPHLPFGNGGLSENQQDAMRHWHHAGAVVFVLWRHAETTALVTWPHVETVIRTGRRSLPWPTGYLLEQGEGFELFDFATVMRFQWPTKAQ